MNRRCAWLGVVVLGLGGAAWAQDDPFAPSPPASQPAPSPAAEPGGPSPGQDAAGLLRDKKIARLDLKDATFENALLACGELTGLEIRFRRRPLEQKGLKADARISLIARNASAYHVLTLIFADAGMPGALGKLLEEGDVTVEPAEAPPPPASQPADPPEGPSLPRPAATSPAGGGLFKSLARFFRNAAARRAASAGAGDPASPAAGDPEPTSQPADPEAVRKAMEVADVYQTNGLHAKAAEIYRKVIKENPDTAAALDAARRLKEMGMKE